MNLRLAAVVVVALLTALPSAHGGTERDWRVVDLRFGPESEARSINGAGDVVGIGVRDGRFRVLLSREGRVVDLGEGDDVRIADNGDIAISYAGRIRVLHGRSTSHVGSFGGSTVLRAINAHGVVVGWSGTQARRPHAFSWRDGVLRDLGRHGLAVSDAVDVNDAGWAVGWRKPRSRSTGLSVHALLWRGTTTTDLGRGGTATGVNDHGQVVGALRGHGFLWDAGKTIDLGNDVQPFDVSDGGVVVGEGPTHHGFLWAHGDATDLGLLPGDRWSRATEVNAGGIAIGFSVDDDPDALSLYGTHAVVWEQGRLVRLPSLPRSGTDWANAINSSGVIVGDSAGHAVLWTRTPP